MKGHNLKVAIVTGAASGIGNQIAWALSSEGYAVGVNDIDFDKAASKVEAIRETGRQALLLPGDVSDEAQMKEMVSKVGETWGRLDVLINNAGISDQQGPVVDQDIGIWQRLIDVHLKGTFIMSKLCAPLMIKTGGGQIVNIASITGLVTFPVRTAYGPAKSAVIRLTQVLALEWAAQNIRVNAVAPGYIRTEMVAELLAKGILNEGSLVKRIPLGWIGTPADIANVVLFLVSENARYITGHTIVVDGGWTAYGFI